MTDAPTAVATRSVVMERELSHPPGKVWRALTTPHLIAEWLMRTDFEPVVDRPFTLSGDWGAAQCRVLEIEPERVLRYSWDAMGLESVVTWTLTPAGAGTHLRMEQAGFRPDQEQAFRGAHFGWTQFLGRLDGLLDRA